METPRGKDGTPPPFIGKAGRLTVFITPPTTPSPVKSPASPPAPAPASAPATPPPEVQVKVVSPPVNPPPAQFEKPVSRSSGSVFGFFWDAVSKVQEVHSSVDEYLADWLGLNQSKYQWALNDYYESKEMGKEATKQKDTMNKVQSV
ncbi:hypothetical protein QJS10_CPB17g00007 [Acorus calamus]|uniref:Uncharacterized protein n=1 Tax=Acorus calamus TaxID=4465 RepID=A0AAV9CWX2_ACOCL|nr:hypothetical protein QJS10_CPB17g00007 [Acorus calamus]